VLLKCQYTLKRLSKAHDALFCSRVLLFPLSFVFDLSGGQALSEEVGAEQDNYEKQQEGEEMLH
jgi:hypothetical protein